MGDENCGDYASYKKIIFQMDFGTLTRRECDVVFPLNFALISR